MHLNEQRAKETQLFHADGMSLISQLHCPTLSMIPIFHQCNDINPVLCLPGKCLEIPYVKVKLKTLVSLRDMYMFQKTKALDVLVITDHESGVCPGIVPDC